MAGLYRKQSGPGAGGAARRRGVLAGLGVVLALSAGCSHLQEFCGCDKAPVGTPCRIAAAWDNTVAHTTDPANGGAPLLGVSGRVYLFEPNLDQPISSDGDLVVDLYDDRPVAVGGQPARLERWHLPKEVLGQLLR